MGRSRSRQWRTWRSMAWLRCFRASFMANLSVVKVMCLLVQASVTCRSGDSLLNSATRWCRCRWWLDVLGRVGRQRVAVVLVLHRGSTAGFWRGSVAHHSHAWVDRVLLWHADVCFCHLVPSLMCCWGYHLFLSSSPVIEEAAPSPCAQFGL